MKPDVIAGIMSALPADVAQKLSVQLANRYKLPRKWAPPRQPPHPQARALIYDAAAARFASFAAPALFRRHNKCGLARQAPASGARREPKPDSITVNNTQRLCRNSFTFAAPTP
jgi:hypothetical protein